MQIDSLKIEMDHWGENKGKYIAEVCIKDEKNKLSIIMNPDASGRLLPLVAEELCTAAANYADGLRQKLQIPQANPGNVRLEDLLQGVPGGVIMDTQRRTVESLAYESNGEVMHEEWSEYERPMDALYRLCERIKKAMNHEQV